MNTSEKQMMRFGGMAFVTAGVLFLAANLLVATLPNPPAVEVDFLNWLTENTTRIAIHNELLSFATVFLIPSVYVLYHLLKNRWGRSGLVGLGLMALAIPIIIVLVIAEGRLVYPVYGIDLSFETLKLVLSIYHGGMHLVFLLFAAAIIFTSYALRGTIFSPAHWYLGLITGAALIIGSYPWLIGMAVNVIIITLFSAWLIYTGATILQKAGQHKLAASQPTRAG